jgi:hypothetical protein
MRRLLTALLLATSAALGGTSTAYADPPVRQDVPDFAPFTLSGRCAFDVQVSQLVNREVTTTFSDGRLVTTGALKVRLANLSPGGRSIDVNVSGPVTYTPNGDGSFTGIFRGRSLIFPNGPEPAQEHIFWVSSGRVVMTVNGDLTVFSLLNVVGTQLDICQQLA